MRTLPLSFIAFPAVHQKYSPLQSNNIYWKQKPNRRMIELNSITAGFIEFFSEFSFAGDKCFDNMHTILPTTSTSNNDNNLRTIASALQWKCVDVLLYWAYGVDCINTTQFYWQLVCQMASIPSIPRILFNPRPNQIWYFQCILRLNDVTDIWSVAGKYFLTLLLASLQWSPLHFIWW